MKRRFALLASRPRPRPGRTARRSSATTTSIDSPWQPETVLGESLSIGDLDGLAAVPTGGPLSAGEGRVLRLR